MNRKDVSTDNKAVSLFPSANGRYVAYLRKNIAPIEREDEDGVVVEYESDLYIVESQIKFPDSHSAKEWFEEHFEELVENEIIKDSIKRDKKEAEEGLRKLNSTDYKVIKAMEEYLRAQGIDIRPDAPKWRSDVNKAR